MTDLNATREYPLTEPYSFEGFTSPEEVLSEVIGSIDTLSLNNAEVLVVRNGANSYGTWGYIYTWDGSQFVSQGHTLEPRSSAGKGPIPIGSYSFKRWLSPNLGKTLRLYDVDGFSDILIHVGNVQADTVGCILAAKKVDDEKDPKKLVDSRILTDQLYDTQSEGKVTVKSK